LWLERVMTRLADLVRGRGYYGKYAKMYHRDLKSVPSLRIVHDMATGRVLDIGCGIGYLSRLFLDYVGVDEERVALLLGRRLSRAAFVQASAYALPFRDGSFDTVILYDIIEHLDDVPFALREAKRVADRVVISLVDFRSYYRVFTHDETHASELTVDDLMPILRATFDDVRVTWTSGIFSLPARANEFVGRHFPNQLVIQCSR